MCIRACPCALPHPSRIETRVWVARALRKSFQKQKKEDIAQEKADADERARFNMHIPLLPASEEDAAAARQQVFSKNASFGLQDGSYAFGRLKRVSQDLLSAPNDCECRDGSAHAIYTKRALLRACLQILNRGRAGLRCSARACSLRSSATKLRVGRRAGQ